METSMSLALSAVLAGVLNLLLVVFVLFRVRNFKGNVNILLLYGVILAIWNFAAVGVYFSLSGERALFWLKFYYISLVFLPSIFFHLVLITIADHRLITKRVCQIGYSLSYLFLILSAIGVMTHDVTYIKGYYYPVGEKGDFLFFVFFISIGVYSLLLLANRRVTTNNIIESSQLRWLFVGGYINILGISSNLLCLEDTRIYPAGHLTTAIYPLIVGYTIVRHDLIPIETPKIVVFWKKIIYLLLSTTIFTLVLVTILCFESIFRKLIGYTSLLSSISIILILAILLQFIRERSQALIDKYFFLEKVSQEQIVKEISRKILSVFDKEVLLDTLLNSIINVMHIHNACIILLDESKQIGQVTKAIGIDVIKKKTMKFSTTSGVIYSLIQSKKPIIKKKLKKKGENIQEDQVREIKKELDALNAAVCIPLTCKDKLLGVLTLGEKMSLEPYRNDEIELLSILCSEAGVAIENANLYQEKMKNFLNTIQSLLTAVEAKNPYTHGHCHRVAKYAANIAQELGLSSEEVEIVKIGAFLHDIGNIGVSEQILNKKGRLTIGEFENVKRHTTIGAKILEPICFNKEIIEGIKFHHERIDGSGYPESLTDKMVPLIAKIITVADVYDAMTSDRPYRKAFTPEDAISEIIRGCGYQFDSKVVAAFIKVLNKEIKSSRILRYEKKMKKLYKSAQ